MKTSICSDPPRTGLRRARRSGAIKYNPYTLLSVSTLGDNLTIAMCIRGNDRDHDKIERFLASLWIVPLTRKVKATKAELTL